MLLAPEVGLVVAGPAGISWLDDSRLSLSAGKVSSFISTRSMTPRNGLATCGGPRPTGICSGDGWRAEPRARFRRRRASKSAPSRSSLLMNASRGTWYLSACRQTVSLWASTPSRAQNTTTRAVEHAQAALDLGREIDVARRVDQVDRDVLPGKRDAGGVDGDAALLLFGVVVGVGRALIDLADAVLGAAVEQHPLGDRGLAGIDVGDDADVANGIEIATRLKDQKPIQRLCRSKVVP